MGGPIVTTPLVPRLLETLVREYWVPLVLFDPDWRVVVWNRGAQDLFGLPLEKAVTGILPERSYGPVLRARVASSEEMMLTGAPEPDGEGAGATLVHRFRRIGNGDELLGFLCVSTRRGEAEPSVVSPATASRPPLGHDLRNALQVISNHAEMLLVEMDSSPAAPRLREILRAVERLMARGELTHQAQAQEAEGRPVDAEEAGR